MDLTPLLNPAGDRSGLLENGPDPFARTISLRTAGTSAPTNIWRSFPEGSVYWKYQYLCPRIVFAAKDPGRSATERMCSADNVPSSSCAYAVCADSDSSVKYGRMNVILVLRITSYNERSHVLLALDSVWYRGAVRRGSET
jgi:hypothetical protein